MAKDSVLQVRYLGVIPQTGYLEYGFKIEHKDKSSRIIVLMIEEASFRREGLMFQEAPDLCYQKMLWDISTETAETPISERAEITVSDIAHYRAMHPTSKSRKHGRSESKLAGM